MNNKRNILDEKRMKEIEESLNNDNLRISWKEGVLEDYWYTKEVLLAKEREEEEKRDKKEIAIILTITVALILFVIIASNL